MKERDRKKTAGRAQKTKREYKERQKEKGREGTWSKISEGDHLSANRLGMGTMPSLPLATRSVKLKRNQRKRRTSDKARNCPAGKRARW